MKKRKLLTNSSIIKKIKLFGLVAVEMSGSGIKCFSCIHMSGNSAVVECSTCSLMIGWTDDMFCFSSRCTK